MSDLLISYYGDDFTGSTDALEFLTRAGARTVLFLEPPTQATLSRYPDVRAVGVAGRTRSMTPEAMEAELRLALAALRTLGAPHVHYKVCSTFDSSPTVGSIGRAIDVAADVFRPPFVPLLVGAPALGRHCVFGNLFARVGIGSDGEIHRLDRHPAMSAHPVTPADESDLRRHLARQTNKRVALFDILMLSLPAADARLALERIVDDGPDVVLFDVLYADQLPRLGSLIDAYANRERPLFSVGSSGVEMALGAHWAAERKLQPVERWSELGAAEPMLVASGSCSPVTARQIEWALERGFTEVALDTAATAGDTEDKGHVIGPAMAAAALLKAGRHVIVHTSTGSGDPRMAATAKAFAGRGLDALAVKTESARLFGTLLGAVVRRALQEVKVQRLCIAGGDTSSYAARTLGIEAVEMIAPLVPGAPLCRAVAPGSPADGLEVNIKGGQVGGANYFGAVVQGRL